MKLSEKILEQLPFHEILDFVEKKTNTPQSVAGKRVGANPGSRKAKLTAIAESQYKIFKTKP